MLWAETPTNPLLRVADLARLGALAAAADAPMVVDNTVATGVLQQPLELGATASLCSLTKASSGHSDVLLGAVLTRDQDLLAGLRDWRGYRRRHPRAVRELAGAARPEDPPAADHPPVRERAGDRPPSGPPSARARGPLSRYRAATLEVARSQLPRGFGPLLSFELDADAAAADAVVAASRLILPATSFGGVESLWERRARWAGKPRPEALIRLSAGIEPAADLIADIDQSLERAARA